MWKLVEIYAQNVCAFREVTYRPRQGVTSLLFGDNQDNDSQKSNGSGKSALIECMVLGITGSPLRKVKNEEIIHDEAEECFVELTFENDSSRERFTVERRLLRRGSSVVKCGIVRDGKRVTTDEAVQPGVDGYNKYILDKLGISREELFNNFILSKHKYQDFLSSSDKEKKEIINRFSNGVLVDQAIEKVRQDKEPLTQLLYKRSIELAEGHGKVKLLREQMDQEGLQRSEQARTKEERLAQHRENMKGKLGLIREKEEEMERNRCSMEQIKEVDQRIQEWENKDCPAAEVLKHLNGLLVLVGTGLYGWEERLERQRLERDEKENRLRKETTKVVDLQEACAHYRQRYDSWKEQYERLCGENKQKVVTLKEQIRECEASRKVWEKLLAGNRKRCDELMGRMEEVKLVLAGMIECPVCSHEFAPSHLGRDVAALKRELAEFEKEYNCLRKEIREADEAIRVSEAEQRSLEKEWWSLDKRESDSETELMLRKSEVDQSKRLFEARLQERDALEREIFKLEKESQTNLRKMFDEAFDLLDDCYKRNERKEKSLLEEMASVKSAVDSLHVTIWELENVPDSDRRESLQVSLYRALEDVEILAGKKAEVERELALLGEQEEHFVQFKTYLANTKVEALGRVTNEFLESIGSDIRIRFSGYTVLKSGKVREKISVSLIRDGVDCGSFGKFSAGEAARVNLATILAMQKLVNANCEDGKGLDLLVLDEILEAVDEDGLACMFDALNKLGVTALVVSHGNIAESYPYKVKVVKKNGESKIE